MIIDFHAHIFPEKIAAKAVGATGSYYGIQMHLAGTVGDLINSMTLSGIDRTLVHSTATKPDQVKAVNDFIAENCRLHPEFIGFGTLHPAMSGLEDEVDRIIALGLHGVKLHADFQNFGLDDENVLYMYDALRGRLPLLLHMGDVNTDNTTPAKLRHIISLFPDLKVIGAHFGGYSVWDEAREVLAGTGVYVDTSSSLPFMTASHARELIRAFGEDRCLFGTDYPMWDPREELALFDRLALSEDERELILHKNAERLLSL